MVVISYKVNVYVISSLWFVYSVRSINHIQVALSLENNQYLAKSKKKRFIFSLQYKRIFWHANAHFHIRPPSWIWQLWRIGVRKYLRREQALSGPTPYPASAPILYQSSIQLQSKMVTSNQFIQGSAPKKCLHCRLVFFQLPFLFLLYSNFSGPKRYDLKNGSWIYTHDGACLHDLLSSEISLALGHEIDFTLLPYGGADENSP